MVLAHVAGVPVEEAIATLAPAGLAGFGALSALLTQRLRRLRRAAVPKPPRAQPG